jgi:aminoglycoside 6'-N-acetyltransferase
MALVDGELALREYRPEDEHALMEALSEPDVRRWWPVADLLREQGWVIEVDGAVAGWLEHHEEPYPWYPSVAFDIFLASRLHGQGYGRRSLLLAIGHFTDRGHHRFTVDPNVENERAIHSYAGIGFARVGVMRAYERNPRGGWNDALLMELIVPEAMARDALAPEAPRA